MLYAATIRNMHLLDRKYKVIMVIKRSLLIHVYRTLSRNYSVIFLDVDCIDNFSPTDHLEIMG